MTTWDRRWDPCIWQDREGAHCLYLATDYQRHNRGGLWWQDFNVLGYQRGPTFDDMALVAEFEPPPGHIWTAPSVIEYEGRPLVIAGINRDGNRPDQRLWFFRLDDPATCIGHPPEPAAQWGFRGAHAWRDATMQRIDGEWALFVATGGFRWGGSPNILHYVADDPLGKWTLLGPIVDPALAVLFAEMERPQVMRLPTGRWIAWWSCWPSRHFCNAPAEARQHVCASCGGELVISQTFANLTGQYGMQLWRERWAAGWEWTDPSRYPRGHCHLAGPGHHPEPDADSAGGPAVPKSRVITWGGRDWRLSELAWCYHLLPQTLASRIDRGLTIERALATGICTRAESGRRAALALRGN